MMSLKLRITKLFIELTNVLESEVLFPLLVEIPSHVLLLLLIVYFGEHIVDFRLQILVDDFLLLDLLNYPRVVQNQGLEV